MVRGAITKVSSAANKSIFKMVGFCMHPTHLLLSLDRRIISTLPDEMFLRLRFRQLLGYKLNLKDPKTFNEKLQWLKLHDRNPKYTEMVDKYTIIRYVVLGTGGVFLES